MAKQAFPSDQQDKFVLRLPDGMRDRIKAAAEKSGRSMNAEIIHALEIIYPEVIDTKYEQGCFDIDTLIGVEDKKTLAENIIKLIDVHFKKYK